MQQDTQSYFHKTIKEILLALFVYKKTQSPPAEITDLEYEAFQNDLLYRIYLVFLTWSNRCFQMLPKPLWVMRD